MVYSSCFPLLSVSNNKSGACLTFWVATNSFSASFCESRHSSFSPLCPWQILVACVNMAHKLSFACAEMILSYHLLPQLIFFTHSWYCHVTAWWFVLVFVFVCVGFLSWCFVVLFLGAFLLVF